MISSLKNSKKIKPVLALSNKIKNNKIWKVTFLVLSILFIIFIPELIAWQDKSIYIGWLTNLSAIIPYIFLVYSAIILLYSISNHYGIAWSCISVLLSFLSFANFMKFHNNGKPFFPWDIVVVWEGLQAVNSMADPRRVLLNLLGLGAGAIILALLLMLILPSYQLRAKTRIILASSGLIVLLGMGFININDKSNENIAASLQLAKQYTNNGFTVSYIKNIGAIPKIPVENYSKETILNIKSSLEGISQTEYNNSIKPDVILIFSESFFDITQLDGLSFSQPVNPFFQELRAENDLNWYSPVFGGQTANAEFEALTGFPLVIFSPQVIPFRLYLRKPTSSVVSTFRDNGYATTMIHPYLENFWSRKRVVPNLGFEEFVSLESMKHTKIRGHFVSDDELVSEAIDVLERKSRKPNFLYLLSIQNHFPFNADRYDGCDDTVEVKSNLLSNDEIGTLNSYSTAVHDSDKSLKRLIDFLKTRNKPTIVVFNGDHLPSLNGAEIYLKTNYTKDPQDIKMHKVQSAVWSNYDISPEPNESLEMCYLPLRLLQWADVELPPYFRLLKQLSVEYPILNRNGIYNKDGKYVDFESFINSEASFKLRHVVYDLMFGKKYIEE